jgi:hypothetical protein
MPSFALFWGFHTGKGSLEIVKVKSYFGCSRSEHDLEHWMFIFRILLEA